MGKPVLATPQALEGLRIEPGVHALSAGDANDCFQAACRLYDDERLCQRLGQAGRDYVREHHCWQTCLAPLASLLRRLPRTTGRNFGQEAIGACNEKHPLHGDFGAAAGERLDGDFVMDVVTRNR